MISDKIIIEEASKAFVLYLSPSDSLLDHEKKTKVDLIHIRNRAFLSIGTKCAKLPNQKVAKTVTQKIDLAKQFFQKIGKTEEESQVSSLSMFNVVQKMIEEKIATAILLMGKPEAECNDKEIAEKKKQKELRNEILKSTREKIKEKKDGALIEKNLEELLSSLSN